jgi:hypothetical protein
VNVKVCLTLSACCAALVFPTGAAALKCAPPGNSGVDQYFETVPGSSCNHSSGGPGGGHNGSLPPGTSKQLASQGAVGQAVQRLVTSSGTSASSGAGTSGARTPRGTGTHAAQSGSGTPVSGSGRGPLSAILHPVLTGSSSGGIGVLLPVLLVGALAGALVATVVRRRLGSSPPGT